EPRPTRPLWRPVDVPLDAEPGTYSGELQVAWQGRGNIPLRLDLEVQEPVIPDPRRWRFRLDLWQNPWAGAHHNGPGPWSPAPPAGRGPGVISRCCRPPPGCSRRRGPSSSRPTSVTRRGRTTLSFRTPRWSS